MHEHTHTHTHTHSGSAHLFSVMPQINPMLQQQLVVEQKIRYRSKPASSRVRGMYVCVHVCAHVCIFWLYQCVRRIHVESPLAMSEFLSVAFDKITVTVTVTVM